MSEAVQELSQVVSLLNASGVIIFPTETLYGLGCDASNPQALLKIYEIKKRPAGKPVPILVKDFDMLAEYAVFNAEQKKKILAAKKPTTFILKAKNLSPIITQKQGAAFRISKHPWVKKLFRFFDRPLIATSANIAGQPPLSDPRLYKEIFGNKADLIDVVVFKGINKKKKGSRIIDLTVRPFKILRD